MGFVINLFKSTSWASLLTSSKASRLRSLYLEAMTSLDLPNDLRNDAGLRVSRSHPRRTSVQRSTNRGYVWPDWGCSGVGPFGPAAAHDQYSLQIITGLRILFVYVETGICTRHDVWTSNLNSIYLGDTGIKQLALPL